MKSIKPILDDSTWYLHKPPTLTQVQEDLEETTAESGIIFATDIANNQLYNLSDSAKEQLYELS